MVERYEPQWTGLTEDAYIYQGSTTAVDWLQEAINGYYDYELEIENAQNLKRTE
jgi:hypothetical protein